VKTPATGANIATIWGGKNKRKLYISRSYVMAVQAVWSELVSVCGMAIRTISLF